MADAELIERLSGATIAVIGDVMLDHHVIGRVQRVSDEAPVPILQVHSERYILGGAANVAANAAALGASVRLVGAIGDDADGARFLQLLNATEEERIRSYLVFDRDRPTIVKTRYLGGQQQIVRVDRELVSPSSPAIEARLIDELEEALDGAGALVLSDYGKSVLTDWVLAAAFALAAKAGVPAIVDPKRKKFADYRGAQLITPNRRELFEAVRLPTETDAEAQAAAAEAIAQSGADILLTRSEKGMSLYRSGGDAIHLPALAQEVFDVSGAGDTVVAVISAGLAARLPVDSAMRLANAAAGVVVRKLGTATLTRMELHEALTRQHQRSPMPGGKPGAPVTPLAEAVAVRRAWGAAGLKVGFANGCFDLLHPGHISLIAQAAEACDRLIVALNTDESVGRLKGPTRPVQALEARARVMGALRGVDLVVAFDEDTPLQIIEALEPDVLVKGADYREDQVVGGDLVRGRGGRVLLAQLSPGESTSAIVKRANTGADG